MREYEYRFECSVAVCLSRELTSRIMRNVPYGETVSYKGKWKVKREGIGRRETKLGNKQDERNELRDAAGHSGRNRS